MPGQVIAYVRVSTLDQNPERQISPSGPLSGPSRTAGSPTAPPAAAPTARRWPRCWPTCATRTLIVVASMDRLARSVVDLDRLVSSSRRSGVDVRFLKEGLTFRSAERADPLAVFQLQVMGAFAQLERALIRDRQREGIEAAKARGVYRGRARRLTPGAGGRGKGGDRRRRPEGRGCPSPRRGPPDPLRRARDRDSPRLTMPVRVRAHGQRVLSWS